MSIVSARDLRNHTADVLRRAAEGPPVTVTVNGSPVAELRTIGSRRPASFSRQEAALMLAVSQADAALRGDLDRLAGDTTDDPGTP